MVEVALVLPVLALLVLFLAQVGLVLRAQTLVSHAAREAARAASVDDDPAAARRAAIDSGPLRADRLDVTVSGRAGRGSRVRVEVRYRAPTDLPLVGALAGDVSLTATATMRVE